MPIHRDIKTRALKSTKAVMILQRFGRCNLLQVSLLSLQSRDEDQTLRPDSKQIEAPVSQAIGWSLVPSTLGAATTTTPQEPSVPKRRVWQHICGRARLAVGNRHLDSGCWKDWDVYGLPCVVSLLCLVAETCAAPRPTGAPGKTGSFKY